MHQFYRGQFFNFEAVRILGTVAYGGAEVAEFLEAIGRIRENDPISWHRAWSDQARLAETIAQEALEIGKFLVQRSEAAPTLHGLPGYPDCLNSSLVIDDLHI